MKKRLVSLSLALCLGSLAGAGDLAGNFQFPERQPFAALVYFGDDTEGGPEICGELDQQNKEFSTRLVAGSTGCDIVFNNSDEMQHNIFSTGSNGEGNFDVGLLPPGGTNTAKVDWPEGTVVRLGCKIHPKMKSYIANVPTKHFAIVSFDGAGSEADFTIANVPDNLSRLIVWFPRMDPMEVTVAAGESKTVDVTRKGNAYGQLTLSR